MKCVFLYEIVNGLSPDCINPNCFSLMIMLGMGNYLSAKT